MISTLLLAFCFALLLGACLNRRGEISPDDWLAILFAVLPAGYATTGLIGILLTRAGTTIPIVLISTSISVATCWRLPNWKMLVQQAWTAFRTDWQVSWQSNQNNRLAKPLVIYLTLGIYVLSIGPINQPDAADYHAGYVHQFFLRHQYFIDGGLTQGLMGLGDFSHLSNFQEKTTWLIRSAQILPLLPLVLLLEKWHVQTSWMLAFLSAPLFIGWATVGKPMFLGDSCIAAGYLLWRSHPNRARSMLLISSLIFGVSFKISVLIIAIPIAIDMGWEWIQKEKKQQVLRLIGLDAFSFFALISTISLAVLLVDRWLVTGNPTFPLLSKVFTPENVDAVSFEQYLKGFGRDDSGFPITLFMPLRAGNLASVLGAAVGILAATSAATLPWKNNLEQKVGIVAVGQFLCLALFGQWRGDYYSAPIILLLASGAKPSHFVQVGRSVKRACKLMFNTTLGVQLLAFGLMASMSLYQTAYAAFDYTRAMNQWAYGFEAIQELLKHKKPYLNIALRGTRLYYDAHYIDPSRYNKCLAKQEISGLAIDKQANAESCFAQLGAKTIMAEHQSLKNSENLQCEPRTFYLGQRNLFNNRKVIVDICNVDPPS